MFFKLRLIPAASAAVLLAACGGGSNSSGGAAYTPTSGVAIDGYLQFSKVVCDTNDNGVANTNEPISYTTSEGVFTFPQGCSHGVILTGGKSKDTQLSFTGQLKAPVGAKVVSPVTSLMAGGMTQAQLNTALGLPANTDLLNTDPAAVTASGTLVNPELLKKTLAVQQLLQKVTETFAALASATGSAAIEPIYNEVAAAFASAMKAGAATPLLTGTALDESVVNTMVKAAGERVLTATAVMPAVQAAITSKGGAAVLADVTSAALKVQADAFLSAPDTAAGITNVTLDRQSNTSIASAVVNAPLSATTSTADKAALATQTRTEAEKPTSTSTTPAAPGILASFDEATPAAILGFNGAEGSSIMAGPAGGSGKAVNVLRTGGDPWAGVAVTTGAIPFTATRKTITARVYSPVAGVPMVLKVEDGSAPPNASAEIAASAPVVVGWQTLTWVVTGLDLTKTYTKVVLLPKLGAVSPVSGDSFFFDDLTLLPEQTTPPPAPSNYLYLANNALSLFDGTTTTSYTMAQFQSAAGINVKWPMANNAALKLNLAENGSFTLASGQTLSAAVAITQDTPAGSGEVKAYIDNVNVTKTGNSIQVTVPTTANAIVYGVSGDGKTKAIIDFANSVKGVTNTLSSAASAVSTIVLGEVVNYAVNGVSNDFTGMYALRGKYKVSIVVTNLPLRQTDGAAFGNVTIQVPTKLDATGAATTSVPVTGPGLEGYINLTN